MSNNAEPEQSARRNDTEAHPYPEEPLKQLVKRIPDLKGIRPSADQQALSMILAGVYCECSPKALRIFTK
jgi:hypothetical protein